MLEDVFSGIEFLLKGSLGMTCFMALGYLLRMLLRRLLVIIVLSLQEGAGYKKRKSNY
jgi:hypothetical protein